MTSSRAGLLLLTATAAGGCVIGNSTDSEPVEFAIGTPQPVRIEPGAVEHDVCVGSTVGDGYVRAVGFDGGAGESIGPSAGAPIEVLQFDGLDCPDASEGFVGWARLRWTTATGRNMVTLGHEPGPVADTGGEDLGGGEGFKPSARGELAATSGEIRLVGAAFPGYQVVDSFVDSSQSGIIGVSVDLGYRDAGTLFGEPASDVPFTISYSPVDLVLFGSSSGTVDIKADPDGHNTLLYNQNTFCSFAVDPNTGDPTDVSVFITPLAGGTVLAGTIAYDDYCF